MLKLTNTTGLTTYLPPQLVASITQASSSSDWNLRSIVKTTQGKTIECRETPEELRDAWEKEMKPC